MRITRIITAAAMTGPYSSALRHPRSRAPVAQLNCDPDDHGVTVEALNTEIVEVCYS